MRNLPLEPELSMIGAHRAERRLGVKFARRLKHVLILVQLLNPWLYRICLWAKLSFNVMGFNRLKPDRIELT
jgi:hypothetical protein